MKTCPSCGFENAEDARFCSQCATRLRPEPGAGREERKIVTCLFCDLVGFTARAERMDPEDVRRLLQPYHARVRSELERFGGTVEKFIGDAVMAVFGAPVAHEDDPERAVRAALSIRDAVADDDEFEVRIGITTGEALVALDARPETGEGMASGDVVNTASRLQAAAPVNGILVDAATHRATERAIEFGEVRAIEAKGKREPVAVREALKARASASVERVGGASLVGREQELALLRETLARVTREREPQLVTLAGVPGIGKSRLVFELFQTIESGAFGLVFWRHGRSLPYGDGVTFWALGEMIKAQAGILESDGAEQAEEKLRQTVASVAPEGTDAAWLERHLRPLAGLDFDESTGGRRDESFAAWRRFLEAIADDRPLVLVFEDLHWADDALLDFVDYLVDWARGVPLLVLCTARPELLARRSGWGGGKANSSSILLTPLSDEETVRLLHGLLDRSALDADLQQRLLEHAGGNPLYAEEFTRMLTSGAGDVVLPETVQGVIAARLDTLPAEEKELLQDAAVIGRVFWPGALGHEPWALEQRLHSLVRKEFVTRNRRSSVGGEDEYAFRHTLVRDVAYEQIPHAERAGKHRAAAEWIEHLGRAEDHAETVAHHWASALEYAHAAESKADGLDEHARRRFREAGDRAFNLHAFRPAAVWYERSLDLWPADPPPELLLRYGRSLAVANDERGTAALERAVDALLAAGDHEAAAEAHAFLCEGLQQRGQGDAAYGHVEAALGLVRDAPPSPAKARVLTELSRLLALGEKLDAQDIAQQAFEMAEALGLTELAARALGNRGIARSFVLDLDGGAADLERSVSLAHSVSSPEEARSLHNLGSTAWFRAELAQTAAYAESAARLSEEFGGLQMATASRTLVCSAKYHLGEWDESLRMASELIAGLESGSPNYFEYHPRAVRARIGLARGADDDLVLADARRAVEAGRSAKDPQAMSPPLSQLVFVACELGRLDEARAAAGELASMVADASPINTHRTVEAAWFAAAVGCDDAIRRLALTGPEPYTWRRLVLAILDRDFESAAGLLASIDHVDEAYARLIAGEQHFAEGRRDEAEADLRKALELYQPLGATRYIRRAEELLAGTSSEISA